MRRLALGFASLVFVLAPAAGAAPLMPFGGGDGSLRLLDPAQPLSATNPITVDTGLSAADLETPITLFAAKIVGTEATNIRQPRLAYLKNGQIFLVNLTPTGSRTPTRLSTITDGCEIDGGREDFADITKSWLKVQRAGPDGDCDTFDDRTTAVKINAGPDAAGITPAGMRTFDALRNPATGAIVGFLTVEGNNPVTLKRRSALMNNPTHITNLADGNREKYERVLADYFIKMRKQGETQSQLFRYEESTGQLHGPLHSFGSGQFGGLEDGARDADNLYFGDGNQVWRVPLDATDAAQAVLVTTITAGLEISELALPPGAARLVFLARNQGNGTSGLFSVPAGAASATATTLRAPAFGSQVELMTTAGSLVYYQTFNFTGSSMSTTKVNADGTSPVTNANTYWAGLVIPTRFDLAVSDSPEDNPTFLIKGVRTSGGSDTLRLVTPSTGLTGKTVGVIDGVSRGAFPGVFAFGLGRYVGAGASKVRGTEPQDIDTFVLDSRTANSVRPVIGTVGSDDYTYFGGG